MPLSSEQKVGIFSLVAIIILGVVTFKITQISDAVKSWQRATVLFKSASGLEEGALVLLAGVRAGKVERIGIQDGKIAVHLKLESKYTEDIRQDSIFSLQRDSLLGQWHVAISLGSHAKNPMDLSQPIQGADAPDLVSAVQRIVDKIERGEGTMGKLIYDQTLFDDLAASAKSLAEMLGDSSGDMRKTIAEVSRRLPIILADMQDITNKAKAGRGVVGRLLTDEQLGADLDKTIKNLAKITADIEQGKGALGKLVASPEMYDDLLEAAAAAKRIAQHIEEGKGAAGKLLYDQKVAADVGTTTANLAKIVESVEKGQGTLGKLIADAELYQQLKDAAGAAQRVMTRIEEGKGAAGKLVNDEQLAQDLADSIASLSKISKAIEEGQGTLGKLVADPQVYNDLREAVAAAKKIAQNIEEGKGVLGKLINDEKVGNDVARLIQSSQLIATRLEKGEGFIGKLLTDDELYGKIKHIVAKMEEAVESYKEQVPISAFGSIVFSAF